jgi:hypothetical protein
VESYPAPAISYPGQAFSEIILPYLFYEKNQDSPHILGCPITRKLHDESLKARQDKPGMEVHAYNSSTQEAEEYFLFKGTPGYTESSRSILATLRKVGSKQ